VTGVPISDLLRKETPFIDVRSPVEFNRGSIPGAKNLPILTDSEREQIGKTYKNSGQKKAIALGTKLVSGSTKRFRVDSWIDFIEHVEDPWIFCWRGGLRSQIAQGWLKDRGLSIPKIKGGYKAMRAYCSDLLDHAPQQKSWFVLGGRTGSGKTILIENRPESINLEKLANHRGSAFGNKIDGQPTPINFENNLAISYLKHPSKVLLIEDEGRTIGRLALPNNWYHHMREVPLIIIETSFEERVQNILEEYVIDPLTSGQDPAVLETNYQIALYKIRKRLGSDRHSKISQVMKIGFQKNEHRPWIEDLLQLYYDPAYDYQLTKKIERVVFQGAASEINHFIDGLTKKIN
tara:strand:- start:1756 stop:2802 length:1047 start_codon:yes stop_codon:yes gene_type:complete